MFVDIAKIKIKAGDFIRQHTVIAANTVFYNRKYELFPTIRGSINHPTVAFIYNAKKIVNISANM